MPLFNPTLPGLITASAIVVASSAPASIKSAAATAKGLYGEMIQICDGTADDVEIQAAIDAINATGNRASVQLLGDIFNCTAQLTAKSKVDVFGPAEIILTSVDAIHTIHWNNITDSLWKDITFRRQGVAAGNNRYCGYFTGTTDKTLELVNCKFYNECTGAVTGLHGIKMENSSSPTLLDCYSEGGVGTSGYCYGISIAYTSDPLLKRCTFQGGSGGANCKGVHMEADAAPELYGCIGTGGSGGTGCNGAWAGYSTNPTFVDCTLQGGSGGTYCTGILLMGETTAVLTNCRGYGGDGGNYCSGIVAGDAASPDLVGCLGVGGGGGIHCIGIGIEDSASPTLDGSIAESGYGGTACWAMRIRDATAATLTGCTSQPKKFNVQWNYDDADNGRFRPFATHPYQLVAISIQVKNTHAGETLDIGTSIGGHEIAQNISIAVADFVYFDLTRVELAGNAYLYATPSAAISDGDVTIWYVVVTNYATCYGMHIDTKGYLVVAGNTILSNGATDALYIASTAVATPNWKVTNSHIETLDPANQKSVNASGILNPAPVYLCTLIGALNNITPAAGTARGSNIEV